ncbi:hypothetical protein BDR22DRAFT_816622 [Usnea florida]
MSPIQPSKRRRLNTSANTLSQPFKSPLKTPLKSTTPDSTTTPAPAVSPTKLPLPPSPPPSTIKGPKATIHPSTTSAQPPLPPNNPTPIISTPPQARPHHQHQTPSASPHYLALQKHHTRLLNSLSTARSALETSEQALRIENSSSYSSSQDKELDTLIRKWKAKSRDAAEIVFRDVRDRVNKGGGVKGLREMERARREVGVGFGWDEKERGEGEGDEEGREEKEDSEGEEFEGGEDERKEGEEEDEEGGYTMDMMLKSLNVELGVIGFDKEAQRWVD